MARNGNGIHQINIKTATKTAGFFYVRPDVAAVWLEKHNPYNRNYRIALEEKYSRDRVNDGWITTDHAISFDWNGHMVNGQHTAGMIVRTGLITENLIVTGLDPRARMVTDIGAPRTPADILRLIGREGVTTNNVAVVRSMMNGTNRRATIPEIVVAYDFFGPAAKEALSWFPSALKKVVIAPVTGALGMASFSQDKTKLQEFAEILHSGTHTIGRAGNAGIYLLRDYLLQLPSRGDNITKHIYGLTEAAIWAFLSNKRLTTLEPAREELFAVPKHMNKIRAKKEVKFKLANRVVVRDLVAAA